MEANKYDLNVKVLEFNKKYRNLKKLENKITLIGLGNSIFALGFIYILAWIAIYGVFKNKHNLSVAKIIEIAALTASAMGLILGLTALFYINKKKEELHDEASNIIKELGEKIKNLDSDNNQKQLSEEVKKKIAVEQELERFKRIRPSLAKQDKYHQTAMYLGIAASSIFVIIEIFAVIQLFKPFGMNKWHGNSPINFQGIIDSVAIALLLVGAACKFYSAIKKRTEENAAKKNDDAKVGETKSNSDLIIPSIVLGAAVINLVGKVIQGCEAAGSFKLILGEDSALSIGFSIRIVSVLIGIGLTLYGLSKICDTSIDSDLKVESYGIADAGMSVDN